MYCWLRSAGFCTKLWLLCNLFNSAKVLVCSQSHVYFCNVCRCGHFCVFGQSSKIITRFLDDTVTVTDCHCHWLSLASDLVLTCDLSLDLTWLVLESWLVLTATVSLRLSLIRDTRRVTSLALPAGTAHRHCPPALPTGTAHRHCPPALPTGTAHRHCPPALPTGTAHRHCPLSLTLYIPYSP